MKKLIIISGVPGSGKSTFIKEHFTTDNAIIISRDEIRFGMLEDGEDYFAHEDEVWNEYVAQIKEAIKFGDKDIVLDATHLNESSRSKILLALGKLTANVEVISLYVECSLETCLDRNEQREGRRFVPRGQIRRMFFCATKPKLEEGFSKLYIYNSETNKLKEREEE